MLPTCIIARHDPFLVAFAALICLATSLFTAWLLPSARTSRKCGLLASLVLGLGAWTTHFVAMLGFEPALSLTYDPQRTAASAILVLIGVGVSLDLWQHALTRTGTAVAGALAGLSIVAMHYVGMLAVSLPGTLVFEPWLVGCSVLAGAVFGAAAFEVRDPAWPRRDRLRTAALLLACIVSLHFLGMASISINDGEQAVATGMARTWLALATGSVSLMLATVFGAVVALDARAARRQLSRDASRLREFSEAAFEALLICDTSGTVLDANSQLLDLCAMERREVVGRPVQSLFQPGAPAPGRNGVDLATLLNGVPVETQRRQIGSGKAQRGVVAVRDVRERVRAEQRIHHMAHHDALTGLANRVVMGERLLAEIARARRTESGFAVLYLDLDRFKPINDVYGHEAGDLLLRQVADRLRAELRSEDTAARLGGDEFAIIQSGLDQKDTRQTLALAKRLLEQVSAPYDLGETTVTISCSIGLATFPDDATDGDALLRSADMALYRAKQAGRATFACFRPEMKETLRDRHALEQDLRMATSRGEISLAWQPQATADGAAVIGFEALMRWQHPVRGNVPPDVFIPMAESSGLIMHLGSWALRTACVEAASWSNPLRVAVNVSPTQVQQTDFPEIVAGVLADTGLAPSRLELEITESLFMSEAERVLETLVRLKALGVRVSLDDFGTGYSSLGTLRKFPFDRIKLDRSFVSRMTDDAQSAAIVQAILGLSRGLGLPVVAEGVETASQLGALRAAQCEEIQGFLIGRPQPIGTWTDTTGAAAPASPADAPSAAAA